MSMRISNARVDLMWFYSGDAECALGLRGQSLERSGGGGSDPVAAAERAGSNVIRYAEVTRRLRRIGPHLERVLRVAFVPHRWRGLERWYELAGVAALACDREDLAEGAKRVAELKGPEEQQMRREARAALSRALAAYAEATR